MIERENSCFCLCYDVKDSVETPCKIFIATSEATTRKYHTKTAEIMKRRKVTVCWQGTENTRSFHLALRTRYSGVERSSIL